METQTSPRVKRGPKPTPPEVRFWKYVSPEPNSGCWLWTGTGARYGQISRWIGTRWQFYPAHRLSYEMHKGPIPKGLVIDHKCRNTMCVNPEHLRAVTQGENVRSGKGTKKTHCRRGHPLVTGNLYFHGKQRYCKPCMIKRAIEWNRKNRSR